jgi:membrane protein YqaA with SNARE-associated domain
MRAAMIAHVVAHEVVSAVVSRAHHPWFPYVVGVGAFVVTITLTFPVEFLVVIATLIDRERWRANGLLAAVGSSLASVALYLAFHHLGWNLLLEWYPDIAKTKVWADSMRWLSEYGAVALFVLMAAPLPIPKVPALAIVAIYRMPIYEAVLAISLGKILKYSLYAYAVSRFPARVRRWYAVVARRRSSADIAILPPPE